MKKLNKIVSKKIEKLFELIQESVLKTHAGFF